MRCKKIALVDCEQRAEPLPKNNVTIHIYIYIYILMLLVASRKNVMPGPAVELSNCSSHPWVEHGTKGCKR